MCVTDVWLAFLRENKHLCVCVCVCAYTRRYNVCVHWCHHVYWMCEIHVHVHVHVYAHVHVRCVKERVSVVRIIYPYLLGRRGC